MKGVFLSATTFLPAKTASPAAGDSQGALDLSLWAVL